MDSDPSAKRPSADSADSAGSVDSAESSASSGSRPVSDQASGNAYPGAFKDAASEAAAITKLAQRLDEEDEVSGEGVSFPLDHGDRQRIRAAWQMLTRVVQDSPQGPGADGDSDRSLSPRSPSRFFYPH